MKKIRKFILATVLMSLFSLTAFSLTAFSHEPVKLGVDNIDSYMNVFNNKRVGLCNKRYGCKFFS
jgi:uncharacterized protein YbbC (DUF1343 family)